MHDIYGDMNVDEWFKKWGAIEVESAYLKTLEQSRSWCTANALNFTPVMLINGYQYPKEYSRTDLIYFIEELSEMEDDTNVVLQNSIA